MIVVLRGIIKGKKETLGRYINHFTKVVVVVGGANYGLKCWIFKRGVSSDCMFQKKLMLKKVHNLKDLHSRIQSYIIMKKNFWPR